MKNFIFTSALLSVLLITISSCKKDNNPSGPGSNSGLLKSISSRTINADGTTDTSFINYISYDNQSRPIEFTIFDSAQGTTTSSWTYYADSIVDNIQLNAFEANSLGYSTEKAVYYLNSQGYATSDNVGDTWTYNSNGYPASWVLTIAPTDIQTTTFTYNSLNQLASSTLVNIAETVNTTYTYLSNPINTPGYSYKGKPNVLFSKAVEVYSTGVTYTINNTYTTDSQNRISTETTINTISSGGTSTEVQYYTYY